MRNSTGRTTRFFATIGFLGILAAIGAAVFFFGGYYSISAIDPDPGPVAWVLGEVRDASINRHATEQSPVALDDAAVIQAGARAFDQRGCTECHGGPGVKWEKFSEGLRPDPPDLSDVAKELTPEQIFWVVKNGINMTGMPSFARVGADDKEIWSIAAFVKKLPSVSQSDYRSWTAPPAAAPPPSTAAPPAPAAPEAPSGTQQ